MSKPNSKRTVITLPIIKRSSSICGSDFNKLVEGSNNICSFTGCVYDGKKYDFIPINETDSRVSTIDFDMLKTCS